MHNTPSRSSSRPAPAILLAVQSCSYSYSCSGSGSCSLAHLLFFPPACSQPCLCCNFLPFSASFLIQLVPSSASTCFYPTALNTFTTSLLGLMLLVASTSTPPSLWTCHRAPLSPALLQSPMSRMRSSAHSRTMTAPSAASAVSVYVLPPPSYLFASPHEKHLLTLLLDRRNVFGQCRSTSDERIPTTTSPSFPLPKRALTL